MTDDATMIRHVAGNIAPELLAAFGEPDFEPVTVTIADMVTVCMDARYQVVDVSLHHRGTGSHQRGGGSDDEGQVERALREAFNEALRQVMQRNAVRLAALIGQDAPRKPPAPAV